MSLFEIASRKKLRVKTTKGELTVEQLWDLPLKAKNSLDLDSIAVALSETLEKRKISFVEEVEVSASDSKVLFDIVLHIIAVKKAERKQAQERASNAATLKLLQEIEAKRSLEDLENLPVEELQKRIAELKAQV